MSRRPRGLLIDFSGTIFRLEDRDRWFSTVVARHGLSVPAPGPTALAAQLEAGGGRPGGPEPPDVLAGMSPELRAAWERRDLSSREHRQLYRGLLRIAGLPWPELADAFYDRAIEPDAWVPYPDTSTLLRECAGAGVPVAVVSNIGWHPGPIFARHGLAGTVSAYCLSFEEGRQKPELEMFEVACAPAEALMIGDSRASDGAAEALGIPTLIIPADPDRRDAARPELARCATVLTGGRSALDRS
jgi:FMN phosphatase YigB (HAD superfamily)